MRLRLQANDLAPQIISPNVLGREVRVPDASVPLTHLQFLRFADCPVCNLHLQKYIKRIAEVRAAGVREIVFFHSEEKFLRDYQSHFPFDVIADPKKIFFSKYKVESSPLAILSPKAWPSLVKGYKLRSAGLPDSSPFGLPADFLIDSKGKILACKYGSHSSDQWSVEELLKRIQSKT